MKKANRIIDELLDHARFDYQIRHEALQNLEEVYRLLDDPLLVNNKEMAADICRILVIYHRHSRWLEEAPLKGAF